MSVVAPLDQLDERLQDAFDSFRKIGEGWHNRLTGKNRRLPERYVGGELEFFCLIARASEVDGKESKAYFEREGVLEPQRSESPPRWVWRFSPVGSIHEVLLPQEVVVGSETVRSIQCYDESMLVHDVQVVHGAEELAVPSEVRLYVDECLPHAFGTSTGDPLNRIFHLPWGRYGLTSPDRKSSPVFGAGGDEVHEVVECASEVVGGVSRNQCQTWGRRVPFPAELEAALASLTVVLNEDYVWISSLVGDGGGVKVVDMKFRPIEF